MQTTPRSMDSTARAGKGQHRLHRITSIGGIRLRSYYVLLMGLLLIGVVPLSGTDSPRLFTVPVVEAQSSNAPLELVWSSTDIDDGSTVGVWGDYDNDGDLDLVVGNWRQPTRLYRNDGGELTETAVWTSTEADGATSLAWGDYDNDGDLDLVVGSGDTATRLYRNDGGELTETAVWVSAQADTTLSIAWGDYDNDGDLDLVVGNVPPSEMFLTGGQNRLYRNDGGQLTETAVWTSTEAHFTSSVAWGDYDNDGDLDLGVGNRPHSFIGVPDYFGGYNQIYRNDSGVLTESAVWTSTEAHFTSSIAWGDLDSDGDLDLVASNSGEPLPNSEGFTNGNIRLYQNTDGWLAPDASWYFATDSTANMALGDYDSDGDLDVAATNHLGPIQVYRNTASLQPQAEPQWLLDSSGADLIGVDSVAWGDHDNDGDLDLAAGASARLGSIDEEQPGRANYLYQNDNNQLSAAAVWTSTEKDDTRSIVWGDYDNDGDLDLAVGNWSQANRLYQNDDGQLTETAVWSSAETDETSSLAWGDYDNDGDLDLAVGDTTFPGSIHAENPGKENHLYRNDGGQLTESATWTSTEADDTSSLAWGDYDNDGDLDLTVGNMFQANQLYRNDGGQLTESATWTSTEADDTNSLAWGDYDNDGDLDLAVGNGVQPNRLYRNDNGQLRETAVWSSSEAGFTNRVVWADYDGDGDLDLVIGRFSGLHIHRNDQGTLTRQAVWSASGDPLDIAVGDADGDGDLDLFTANEFAEPLLRFYRFGRNNGSSLQKLPSITTRQPDGFPAAAGFATGTVLSAEQISVPFAMQFPTDISAQVRVSYSVNGGSNWQPALTHDGTNTIDITPPERIRQEQAQPLGDGAATTDTLILTNTQSLHDLQLDLTIDHPASSKLAASLFAPWPDADGTMVTLFADLTTDSTGPVNITFADQGGVLPQADTQPDGPPREYASTDVPVLIPEGGPTRVITSSIEITRTGVISDVDLMNLAGTHTYVGDLIFTLRSPAGTEVLLFENICGEDDDFILSLDDDAAPNPIPCPPIDGATYQPLEVLDTFNGEEAVGTWTLLVEDTFPEEDGGSLDGWGLRMSTGTQTIEKQLRSGVFRPEQPLDAFDGAPPGTPFTLTIADTITDGTTGTLDRWGLRPAKTQGTYTYIWNTFGSGIFGQSDNVVLRFEAFPEPAAIINGLPGPYQYASTTTQTFPFRVRGTQVRVVDERGAPVPDALVYRLPADAQTAGAPITDGAGTVLRTDAQGYLAGRGEIQQGDTLFALAPAPDQPGSADSDASVPFTLYHTNGTPTEIGLDSFTVETPGVQELVVSADNPLVLFDLEVSLEWDASQDPLYLDQLRADLRRASAYLYDWSNGRAALGTLFVSQNADNWAFAHINVHADNSLRPFAAQGGIVSASTPDPDIPDVIYEPGQIAMGATWNRYGDPGNNLAEDWPVTLAHELGHYLFYLDDVYLGLDETGNLIAVDSCVGSPMGDVYTNPGSAEFYWDSQVWSQNCANTLANRTLNRTEWANITTFYPELPLPTADNPGPNTLPFDLTQVMVEAPITPTNVLADPTFYLDYSGAGRPLASNQAEVYRQADLDGDGVYDYIVAHGGPSGGQNRIKVHGAAPGDRLCAFDALRRQFGCEVVERGDDRLALRVDSTWNPVIQMTPVTSTTFDLAVTGVPTDVSLLACAYPEFGTAPEAITLNETDDGYNGTLVFEEVSFYGAIQLYIDEAATETQPRRETVVTYSVGGNPGKRRNSKADLRGGGGKRRNSKTDIRSGGANLRAGNSPVASSDGQFILYTENPIVFDEGDFYVIQTMSNLPQVPPGRTPIGTGYNLIVAPEADPDKLGGSSVSFEYLGTDVIAAQADELDLTVYHWDGSAWTQLDSTRDPFYNLVSAPSQGPGVYALFASIELTFDTPGWNLFPYLVRESLPVEVALASIDGAYGSLYAFEAEDSADPWKVFNATWPAWANQVDVLEFGEVYYLWLREGVTIYFSPDPGNPRLAAETLSQVPPTTFYGTIRGNNMWTPATGQIVAARRGGMVCGTSTTQEQNGQVVYVVDVLAECGTGTMVEFTVDGMLLGPNGLWDNTQSGKLNLAPAGPSVTPTPTAPRPPKPGGELEEVIYLPLLRH